MGAILEAAPLTAYQGDTWSAAAVLPVSVDEDTDLSWVTAAAAVYVRADGTTVNPAAAFTLDAPAGSVAVTFTPFTVPGLGRLLVTLSGAGDVLTLPPHPVIVQADDGWLDLDTARRLWADAPDDDAQLFMVLHSARGACLEFAPLEDPAVVPLEYRQAQLVQAINTWEATAAGGGDSLGVGEFAVPRHPLDWHVRQMLRPRSGMPAVT